jgi:hypothetical protein
MVDLVRQYFHNFKDFLCCEYTLIENSYHSSQVAHEDVESKKTIDRTKCTRLVRDGLVSG